jgi:hypothetical protein
MAFGRVKKIEAQLAGYRTSHNRADQRLDRTGPALVQALGDTVVEHAGGRSHGVTVVQEGYEVVINNNPFDPTVTLVATKNDVPSVTWRLSTSDLDDFDPDALEEMEKWTVAAKTGVPVDDERHAKRASVVNQA